MSEWWRFLRGRPFYWALDGTHPAADLVMLREVIERPGSARPLRAARLALKASMPVAAARARLAPHVPLWQRYEGLAWRLCWLAELGVPGDDEAIATALDLLLDAPLPPDVPAAPALLVQMAATFGFGADERVQRLISILGHDPPGDPSRAALALAALAALPDPPVGWVRRIADGLATIAPADLPGATRFAAPTYDRPDALSLARAALHVPIRDAWLGEWVRVVEEAQDEKGLWRLDEQRPTPGIPPFPGEAEGQPSRLLTARALYVLRAWHGEG